MLLVLVGGVMSASAGADWVGNSAINVNGTWYYAGNSGMSWCSGGAFDGANLGIITNLSLGGQSQLHDGNDNWNWNGGTMTMGYKIDGGTDKTVTLTYYKYEDHHNFTLSKSSSVNPKLLRVLSIPPA